MHGLEPRRAPGWTVSRSQQASLAGRADTSQTPPRTESEINQLDVMDSHVRARITAGDPGGKLSAADLLGLEQRTIAVVDVLQDSVAHMSSQLLVTGIGELVIDNVGEHILLFRKDTELIQFLPSTDGSFL